jgi:hypothetical protein
MGLTLFGWQFCTCLAHWLYAFRYWVIAQDISLILYGRPSSAGAEDTRRKERCYKFMERIGTAINFLFCLVSAVLRSIDSLYLTG